MAEEQKYTHLVLLLDKDMSIDKVNDAEEESIYISKTPVPLPNDGGQYTEFTVDNLQTELVKLGGNLRLDVFLEDNLTVAKCKVSNVKFENDDNNYESVKFNGIQMHAEIVRNAQKTNENTRQPPPPPPKGGMKLNKKPKKKTKKGTYKRQSNKTK